MNLALADCSRLITLRSYGVLVDGEAGCISLSGSSYFVEKPNIPRIVGLAFSLMPFLFLTTQSSVRIQLLYSYQCNHIIIKYF